MFDSAHRKNQIISFESVNRYLLYIIPAYFIIVFAAVISNSFPAIKYFNHLHFTSVVLVLLFLITLIFMFFRLDDKKRYVSVCIYAAFFLLIEIMIQATGGINSVLYPLLYLFILVCLAASPLTNALIFLALTVSGESMMILRLPGLHENVIVFNTHIFFYMVFFIIFYFTLLNEKKQKDKYRLLLKTYEGLKESKDPSLKDSKNFDITLLSEQGRRKHDISITHKLNEKIYEILYKIKEIMHPFTIIYLEIDKIENKFFIKEVISESDHINYNLEVDVDSGYLGWVAKNKRTLNINNFDSSIQDIFHYTSDEVIKSLIMIPVMNEDDIRGVLLADSRELQYFSNKEENLLYIASYQITQEINNFKIMLRVEYNAKESRILNQLGKKLNVSLDLHNTIQVVISTIIGLVTCDLVAVVFLNDDEKHCTINSVHGEGYEYLSGREFVAEEGICKFVLEKKRKVLFRDFSSVSSKKYIFDNKLKLKDLHTVYMLPLISNDIAFGAVLIASRTVSNLTDHTVKTIETLVNQSAISIANAKIYMKVEMLATTDGLTGLFNHRCFQDRITEEIERIKRYPENLSLLLMDIDHFKRFNDTYGHPVGDKVLKTVADIFSNSLRKVDFAARYGGEEFVAILVNTDKEGALRMGERIRKNIEREDMLIGNNDVNITVSIGVATYPDDSKNKKELINLADKALYFAKESGRNRCTHIRDISTEEILHD